MTKVSSTNLSHREGGLGQVLKVFTSNFSMNRLGMRGADGGFHSYTLDLFIILTLEEEVSVGKAELQYGCDLWYGHVGPLW